MELPSQVLRAAVYSIAGHGYTLDGITGPFCVECICPGEKDAELSSADSSSGKFCCMTP